MKNNSAKTFLTFLVIGCSTIPILKQSFTVYLLIFCSLFTLKEFRIYKEAFVFLWLVVVLEIYHIFSFDNYDTSVTRGIILTLVASIIIINYIKLDFLSIYIQILYYFSIISFFFFILYYLDKSFIFSFTRLIPDVFIKTSLVHGSEVRQINPIFYNFDNNYLELGRNNGPFWEPTVFASMLIIAQIFNILLNKVLFNKKGLIFTIAIFTTFSTTAFLAYFLLIFFYLLFTKRIRPIAKIFLLIGVALISISLFTKLTFLSDKISNEIEKADYEMDKYGGDSRLASAILDINEISEKNAYILFGKGIDNKYRISGPDKEALRNCGDTTLLVQWGILFSIIYILLLYFSFLKLTKFYLVHGFLAIVFTLIILVLGFSEVYFNLPIFYSLLFLGFLDKNEINAAESAKNYPELETNGTHF